MKDSGNQGDWWSQTSLSSAVPLAAVSQGSASPDEPDECFRKSAWVGSRCLMVARGLVKA